MDHSKWRKALATGLLLFTLGHVPAVAAEPEQPDETTQEIAAPKLDLGYNAIEYAVTSDGTIRTRILVNVDYEIGGVKVGVSGLDQVVDDGKEYFGSNTLLIGDGETRFAIVNKRDASGSIDTKVGIRNTGLPKLLGADYGSVKTTVDSDAGNVTTFLGKDLPRGWNVELFHNHEFPYSGADSSWTEVQVSKKLDARAKAFARAETDLAGTIQYLVGVALHK